MMYLSPSHLYVTSTAAYPGFAGPFSPGAPPWVSLTGELARKCSGKSCKTKMRARTVLNGLPPICCTTLHNPAEITCFGKHVGRVCMFQLDTEMFSLPYQLSYQLSSCNFSITMRFLRCQRFVAGYADWSSHARKIQTGSWSKRWVLCFSIYKMMGLHSRH